VNPPRRIVVDGYRTGRSTADIVTPPPRKRVYTPPTEDEEYEEEGQVRFVGPEDPAPKGRRMAGYAHPASAKFIAETPAKSLTEDKAEGEVLVFRRPDNNRPVAVPDEVVLGAERPYRAYRARMTGMSWQQVAIEEGYTSPQAAALEVNRYLEEGRKLVSDASAGALINLELSRLDALQEAIWPAAMGGHLPSVSVTMQLVMSRVKLMGLEVLAEKGEGTGAPRTVVVPMDSAGFVAALQEA